MESLNDYGGYSHGGKTRKAVRGLENGATVSMRCLDCNKLNYVPRLALHRAASPRCSACGGPMEEIDVSRKRSGLETTKKLTKAISHGRKSSRRCPGCGCAIADNVGLESHLTDETDCRHYHVESGRYLLFPGSDKATIPGTVHIVKASGGGKPWHVVGLNGEGETVTLTKCRTKGMAEAAIDLAFGPVELAR